MTQQPTIHSLPIVPYIIAERAVWNILDEKHKDLSPEQCSKIVAAVSPKLVERAEVVYSNNEHFRKKLNHKRTDPRYYLEMFMEHWTLGLLNREKIKEIIT